MRVLKSVLDRLWPATIDEFIRRIRVVAIVIIGCIVIYGIYRHVHTQRFVQAIREKHGIVITDFNGPNWLPPYLRIENPVSVNLSGKGNGDELLAEISRFSTIRSIETNETVSDVGIAQLKQLPNLERIALYRCSIHGEELRDLKTLQVLHLYWSDIDDDGMVYVAGLPRLRTLSLVHAHVSDRGLAHLENLQQLEALGLDGKGVTDAGLAHVEKLSNLKSLYLNGTQITDEGLRIVGTLKNLEQLWLNDTAVTDRGLEHLTQLSKLQQLNVNGTYVTMDGADKLKRAVAPNSLVISFERTKTRSQ